LTPPVRAALKRLVISLGLSLVFAFVVSEVSYQLVKDRGERPPRVVEILIPLGTAENIANGLPGPILPEMTFVEGDQIVVRNFDKTSHQLGPLWVPPNASSTLALDRPNQYTMECSFQEDRVLGLDVLPRAKASDRVFGMVSIGLPTWILAWLYSLVAIPLPGNDEQALEVNE